jgi:D-erythronate 2-dehydrogenase
MDILVIGAAGMLGRKLCEALSQKGLIGGRQIAHLTMADAFPAEKSPNPEFSTDVLVGDIGEPSFAQQLLASRPQIIFHLAAIVSGQAEKDFETGYRTNLDGARHLFEAVRWRQYQPRLIFSSSIAVFGKPFPTVIGEDYVTRPLTSYGTQKAMAELLLNDFSRREIFDGVALRLPTICVRPGKPNQAASGFFSNIIREPLKGEPALLPVSREARHWFASPRSALRFLLRAAEMDTGDLGSRRTLNMPGLSVTVGEMIESLERVGGPDAVGLIETRLDPFIQKIVDNWPQKLDASRAEALGFSAEKNFDEIIRAHIEDETAR